MSDCANQVIYTVEVNQLLFERYGVTDADVGKALIERCYLDGKSPKECVDRIGDQYDLSPITGD